MEIVESFEVKVRDLSDMVEKYANANLLPDIEDEEVNIGHDYIDDFYNEEFSI